ncbi:hypothetical protein B0H15DRAFT_812629 [Mycena belliarum]|uniref:Chitin-binding type-4 domain-containing protein n=1 Tax=Mycena belliarum TaxID=1033014 RepID=A0AAD6UPL7_9AGAR|nr:hypothetical protein B0H15DRAFT_812629 [Mycena belliae]
MVYIAAAFALLGLARLPAVLAHARVNSPPIRTPGNDHLQKCGQPSFTTLDLDATGHIEEQEPVNAGCELTLCRGMLFSDQPASNVQTVKASQAMEMGIDCTIPHGGPANVSLIDTTVGGAGAFIGSFLKTFDDFCPTTGPTPADQTKLQYTLPNATTIGNKCQKAGDCVVQLFWATPDLSQNYYYCVDVVMAAAAPKAIASTRRKIVKAKPTVAQAPKVVVKPTVNSTPATIAVQPAVQPTVIAQVAVPAVPKKKAHHMASAISKFATTTSVGRASGTALAARGTTAKQNAGRRRARILWF